MQYPQVVFDFTVPIFMIVCSKTWLAHLKVISKNIHLGT